MTINNLKEFLAAVEKFNSDKLSDREAMELFDAICIYEDKHYPNIHDRDMCFFHLETIPEDMKK